MDSARSLPVKLRRSTTGDDDDDEVSYSDSNGDSDIDDDDSDEDDGDSSATEEEDEKEEEGYGNESNRAGWYSNVFTAGSVGGSSSSESDRDDDDNDEEGGGEGGNLSESSMTLLRGRLEKVDSLRTLPDLQRMPFSDDILLASDDNDDDEVDTYDGSNPSNLTKQSDGIDPTVVGDGDDRKGDDDVVVAEGEKTSGSSGGDDGGDQVQLQSANKNNPAEGAAVNGGGEGGDDDDDEESDLLMKLLRSASLVDRNNEILQALGEQVVPTTTTTTPASDEDSSTISIPSVVGGLRASCVSSTSAISNVSSVKSSSKARRAASGWAREGSGAAAGAMSRLMEFNLEDDSSSSSSSSSSESDSDSDSDSSSESSGGSESSSSSSGGGDDDAHSESDSSSGNSRDASSIDPVEEGGSTAEESDGDRAVDRVSDLLTELDNSVSELGSSSKHVTKGAKKALSKSAFGLTRLEDLDVTTTLRASQKGVAMRTSYAQQGDHSKSDGHLLLRSTSPKKAKGSEVDSRSTKHLSNAKNIIKKHGSRRSIFSNGDKGGEDDEDKTGSTKHAFQPRRILQKMGSRKRIVSEENAGEEGMAADSDVKSCDSDELEAAAAPSKLKRMVLQRQGSQRKVPHSTVENEHGAGDDEKGEEDEGVIPYPAKPKFQTRIMLKRQKSYRRKVPHVAAVSGTDERVDDGCSDAEAIPGGTKDGDGKGNDAGDGVSVPGAIPARRVIDPNLAPSQDQKAGTGSGYGDDAQIVTDPRLEKLTYDRMEEHNAQQEKVSTNAPPLVRRAKSKSLSPHGPEKLTYDRKKVSANAPPLVRRTKSKSLSPQRNGGMDREDKETERRTRRASTEYSNLWKNASGHLAAASECASKEELADDTPNKKDSQAGLSPMQSTDAVARDSCEDDDREATHTKLAFHPKKILPKHHKSLSHSITSVKKVAEKVASVTADIATLRPTQSKVTSSRGNRPAHQISRNELLARNFATYGRPVVDFESVGTESSADEPSKEKSSEDSWSDRQENDYDTYQRSVQVPRQDPRSELAEIEERKQQASLHGHSRRSVRSASIRSRRGRVSDTGSLAHQPFWGYSSHYKEYHPPLRENDKYGINNDGGMRHGQVSWDDLDSAIKACQRTSLEESRRSSTGVLQQDGVGQNTSHIGRGGGGNDPVTWDDLDSAIEAGRLRSLQQSKSSNHCAWGDLDSAIEAGRRMSLQQSKSSSHYSRNHSHLQDSAIREPYNVGRGDGRKWKDTVLDPVSWDDLGDAIEEALLSSVTDLSFHVTEKQEWRPSLLNNASSSGSSSSWSTQVKS